MKDYLIRQCVLLVMLIMPSCTFAQWYEWMIAVKKYGKDTPEVSYYASVPETASNGVEYGRIRKHMQLPNQLWNWVPQQYGTRISDKKIYVYDFEKDKEMLAFDFALSVGDEFTTINGMKWVVREVSDTLWFCNQYDAMSESYSFKLLKVQTTDGKLSDQWMEDFGSFTNHLMITDMSDVEHSQTPWIFTDCGYIAREFSCDPFFGHDTGWMEGHYDSTQKDEPVTTVTYEDGNLTFTNHRLWWPARYYQIFYRTGDDIRCCSSWEFQPHIDSGESFWATDEVVFKGLPAPASGSYTLHIGNTELSVQIPCINPGNSHAGPYDLQGRRYTSFPFRGVFIKDGKKVVWK